MPFMDSFARGLGYGWYGMGESLGQILDLLGAPQLGQEVADKYAQKKAQYAPPPELQGVIDNPALIGNPEWWGYGLGSITPTMLASVGPGSAALATTRAALLPRVLSGAMTAGKAAARARGAGAIAGGIGGGLLETGSTYGEAVRGGMPREEARLRAIPNMAAMMGLNALPMERLFAPLGKYGTPGRMLEHGIAQGLSEWAEEPVQAAIYDQDVMKAAKAGADVFLPAMVSGGIIGSGAPFVTSPLKDPAKKTVGKGLEYAFQTADIRAPGRLMATKTPERMRTPGAIGRGFEFYSPNVGEGLSLDEAIEMSRGDEVARIGSIADDVNKSTGLRRTGYAGSVGRWKGDSEGSVYEVLEGVKSLEQLEHNAAWKAKLGNQLSALVFAEEAGGPQSVYTMTVPDNMKGVAKTLAEMQIEAYTMSRGVDDDSTGIQVYDPDTTLYDLIEKVAEKYDVQYDWHRGRGRLIGGDTRAEAQAAFNEVIARRERQIPSEHYRPTRYRDRDSWGSRPPVYFSEAEGSEAAVDEEGFAPPVARPVVTQPPSPTTFEEAGNSFTIRDEFSSVEGEFLPDGAMEIDPTTIDIGVAGKDVSHRIFRQLFNQAYGRGVPFAIDPAKISDLPPGLMNEFARGESLGLMRSYHKNGKVYNEPLGILSDRTVLTKQEANQVIQKTAITLNRALNSDYAMEPTTTPSERFISIVKDRAMFDRDIIPDRAPTGERVVSIMAPTQPYQRPIIASVLEDLHTLGVPMPAIELITGYGSLISSSEGHQGVFDAESGDIAINAKILEAVNTIKSSKAEKMMRIYMAHEIGHAMTIRMSKDGTAIESPLDASPQFHLDLTGVKVETAPGADTGKPVVDAEHFGGVIGEMFNAYLQDGTKIDQFLSYPFNALAQAHHMNMAVQQGFVKVMLGGVEQYVPAALVADGAERLAALTREVNDLYGWIKHEAFAQGWTLYINMPALVKKELPQTYQFMEEMRNAAREGKNWEVFGRVSDAVRTFGSFMGVPEVQRAGAESAAGARAENRQAGAGVRPVSADARGSRRDPGRIYPAVRRAETILSMYSAGSIANMNNLKAADELVELLGTRDTDSYNSAKAEEYRDGFEVSDERDNENDDKITAIVLRSNDEDYDITGDELEDFANFVQGNWEQDINEDGYDNYMVIEWAEQEGHINGPPYVDYDEVETLYENAVQDIIGDDWSLDEAYDGTGVWHAVTPEGISVSLYHSGGGVSFNAYDENGNEIEELEGYGADLKDAAESAFENAAEYAAERDLSTKAMPRPTKEEAKLLRKGQMLERVAVLARVYGAPKDPLMIQIIAAARPVDGGVIPYGVLTKHELAAVIMRNDGLSGEYELDGTTGADGETLYVLKDGDRVIWRTNPDNENAAIDFAGMQMANLLMKDERETMFMAGTDKSYGGLLSADPQTWPEGQELIKQLTNSSLPAAEKVRRIRETIKKFFPGDSHVQSRIDKMTREIDKIVKTPSDDEVLQSIAYHSNQDKSVSDSVAIGRARAQLIREQIVRTLGEGGTATQTKLDDMQRFFDLVASVTLEDVEKLNKKGATTSERAPETKAEKERWGAAMVISNAYEQIMSAMKVSEEPIADEKSTRPTTMQAALAGAAYEQIKSDMKGSPRSVADEKTGRPMTKEAALAQAKKKVIDDRIRIFTGKDRAPVPPAIDTVRSREELPEELRDRMQNEWLRAMRAGQPPGGAVSGTERQEQMDQLKENVGTVFPTVEEQLQWREERKNRIKEQYGGMGEIGAGMGGARLMSQTGAPSSDAKTWAGNTPQENLERARRGTIDPSTGGGLRFGPRRVQSNAQTMRLAELLGTTPRDVEHLMRRKLGEAYNAEQLVKAAGIIEAEHVKLEKELTYFFDKLNREELTNDDLVRAQDVMMEVQSLNEQYMGLRAEAGRALQIYKRLKNNTEKVRAMAKLMGGPEAAGLRMAALANMTPGERMRALRDDDFLFGPLDKFQEAWLAMLLTGPQTHVVNVTSNFLVQALEDVERFVAAAVGMTHGGPKVTFGEAMSRLYGWGEGSVVGVKEMARAMRSEEYMIEIAQKLERQTRAPKIGGKVGKVIRLPFRFLTAEDMFFKGLTLSKELRALAHRMSRETGQSVEEILADPPEEMVLDARKAADEATFTTPLGNVGKAYLKVMNQHPMMRFLTPFVTTPVNIVKFAGKRTLLGPLFEDVREDLKAGGARRDLALARMTTGTSIMMAVYLLAMQGLISGQGPEDPAEKAAKRAAGWQPYSVKLGNQWVSFSRFEPSGMLVGVAADMAELTHRMDDSDIGEIMELALGSFFKNITSKTFLKGLTDMVEAISDPERYGEQWINSFAGTVVPTGVAQIARTQDPYLRRTETIFERIKSRLPGRSQELLPRRDMFGKPIKTEGGVGPDIISPAYISTISNDPVAIELDRLGSGKRAPSKSISGVELKPAEHDYYHAVSGQLAHRLLTRLIQANGWKNLSDDTKRDIVDRVYTMTRAAARQATVQAHKDIARRYVLQQGG